MRTFSKLLTATALVGAVGAIAVSTTPASAQYRWDRHYSRTYYHRHYDRDYDRNRTSFSIGFGYPSYYGYSSYYSPYYTSYPYYGYDGYYDCDDMDDYYYNSYSCD